ncbi:MAG: DUF4135 domain-containing protein [Clostridia bacterium]|nr:DUF4135 domain-containing protein [Clostridia bacterium]
MFTPEINNMPESAIYKKVSIDEELRETINRQAVNYNIAPHPINEILDKAKNYYESRFAYITSAWKLWYDDYPQACSVWALKAIKNENPEENNLYLELEKCKKSGKSNHRINDIINMLSTEKIFEHSIRNNKGSHTLHEVFLKLNNDQVSRLKECILRLKKYCDAEGIKSILQSANKNDINLLIDFDEKDKEISFHLADYFIKRLELITLYIKQVAETEYNGKKFWGKYWIRSTGSDLHHEGQHALFLVNKQNRKGNKNDSRKKAGAVTKVYKPHDLSADNVVVGNNGMLAKLNNMINTKDTILKGEKPFATMNISVKNHTEEFIIKKDKMTKEEAKKYFFRAGMLKVITDAMAVIDLHQDNIMPILKNMPLIIDAEIDFFQYTNSCLENLALKRDKHVKRISNSSFEVEEEKKRSGKLFSNENSIYHKTYEEGYNFMVYQMYENKDIFTDLYADQLENVNKVRIIPLGTDLLAGILQKVIIKGTTNDDLNDLSEYINEQLDNVNEEKFIFRKDNSLKVDIQTEQLKNAINETFRNGTIIALYVAMDGKIYLDNTEIGKIVTLQGNFDVDKDIIIDVMKNSFLRIIDQLYNKMLLDESGLSQIELFN